MEQGFLEYLSSRETLQQIYSGKAAAENLAETTVYFAESGMEPNRVFKWVEKKREYGRTEGKVSRFVVIHSGKPTEDENSGHQYFK